MASSLAVACLRVYHNGTDYDVAFDQIEKLWPWLYERYIEFGKPSLIRLDSGIPSVISRYVSGDTSDVGKEQRIKDFKAVLKYPNQNVIPKTDEFARYLAGFGSLTTPQIGRLQHFLDTYGDSEGPIKYAQYLVEKVTGKSISDVPIGTEIFLDEPAKFRVHKYMGKNIPNDKIIVIHSHVIKMFSHHDVKPFFFLKSARSGDISLISDDWEDWPHLYGNDLELLE